ncbi:universal stress protein [Pseudomonas sp. F1_0610]|uniref:universal stress protein n=1 Tax=Pseudomonas sp. F1_0610 TaxID=3114284 RepID=UPI0039C36666
MFKHILIAHDLTTAADIALLRAAQLAKQHQAQLTILHVQDTDLIDEQSFRQQLPNNGLEHAKILLKQGKPSDVMVAISKAYAVDLLVLGDHHQDSPSGFQGTTLERVLQQSKVPTLLAVNNTPQPYMRGLAPLDFSKCACKAFITAIQLMDVQGELHAINVAEGAEVHGDASTEDKEWEFSLLQQLIDDELRQVKSSHAKVIAQVLHGELANCLNRVLQQQQPELLALGRRGRGLMADVLLGSLATYFLAHPPCDVLLAS